MAHKVDWMDQRDGALQELAPTGCFNLARVKAQEDVRAIDATLAEIRSERRR
jgi:hypothetical protein